MTFQDKWEKKSTVRTRSRVIFNCKEEGHIYPLTRQPICLHPDIEALGTDALNYLLIQSFYKFCYDIAMIETRFTNYGILLIINNILPLKFTAEQKLDLFTVMVDEAYHAYVAYDSQLQIERHFGIKPLSMPLEIQIELAMNAVKYKLPSEYRDLFFVIAVCLAENTITKDIHSMINHSETHPFFQQIIKDHYADEAKHAGIFFNILTFIWKNIESDAKRHIAQVLPEFLKIYLGLQTQTAFDKNVIISLGLDENVAEQIIQDTYGSFEVTSYHPMLKNILTILDKANVIDTFMASQFETIGWK